jgi:preprotein translocase subunit SecD
MENEQPIAIEYAAESGETGAEPETVYVVDGAIQHDGQRFAHGASFPASLATSEQIAALRKAGALKLPAEVLSAEDVQAQLAARDAEIARLRGLVGAQVSPIADDEEQVSKGRTRGAAK